VESEIAERVREGAVMVGTRVDLSANKTMAGSSARPKKTGFAKKHMLGRERERDWEGERERETNVS